MARGGKGGSLTGGRAARCYTRPVSNGPRWGKGSSARGALVSPRPGLAARGAAADVRISLEFIRGFRALHFVGPCVTVFGSARFADGHRYYELGPRDGRGASRRAGFTVMTGGGPGIMEAANRGAREAGGRSIGCNIQLPQEQKPNAYLDRFVDVPALLRAQGDAGQVLVRVRRRCPAASARSTRSSRPRR